MSLVAVVAMYLFSMSGIGGSVLLVVEPLVEAD